MGSEWEWAGALWRAPGRAASLRPRLTAGISPCLFADHVLRSGESRLHAGLQCLSDFPYHREPHSLPLPVSVGNEQFCCLRPEIVGLSQVGPSEEERDSVSPSRLSLRYTRKTPLENPVWKPKHDTNIHISVYIVRVSYIKRQCRLWIRIRFNCCG